MSKLPVLLLLLISLFLINCNDDFQINAKWKDITIVYCLLNPSEPDSQHFVRINRAFLNDKNDALMLAQNPDSTNYQDSLFVRLEYWKNNTHVSVNDIVLYRIPNNHKDSGIFANTGQYLWATPKKTVLDQEAIYKLRITNTVTGKEVWAETPIVGNIYSLFPKVGNKITISPKSNIDFQWYSGKNAFFYDVVAEIWYNEFPASKPEEKTKKVLYWPIAKNYVPSKTDEIVEMKVTVPGISFYQFLKDNIPVNYDINREFLRIDFIYSAGGEEIYNYMNVNKPSIGIVQKKPEYTNISNGLGVFSSRNRNVVSVQITPTMRVELQTNDLTRDLNFIR
ncbi:MAG: hypothetical protein GX437_03105 [Sphingobacteriales bacterium]|nr:hypothetical protein [Sphingobacteriales bacterium]